MLRNSRCLAQSSPELLVIFSAILIIFIVFSIVYLGQRINLFQNQDTLSALNAAYALSSAINYVYLAGDGANYNFTLPLDPFRQNITISTVVSARKVNAFYSAPLLNRNINVSSVNTSVLLIRNNQGVITIEQQ